MDVVLVSLYMPGKATYFFPKPFFSGGVVRCIACDGCSLSLSLYARKGDLFFP
ncbi:hypothetical protein KJ640_00335 [bacterium]|nr:hypothetical protein [bacterium]